MPSIAGVDPDQTSCCSNSGDQVPENERAFDGAAVIARTVCIVSGTNQWKHAVSPGLTVIGAMA